MHFSLIVMVNDGRLRFRCGKLILTFSQRGKRSAPTEASGRNIQSAEWLRAHTLCSLPADALASPARTPLLITRQFREHELGGAPSRFHPVANEGRSRIWQRIAENIALPRAHRRQYCDRCGGHSRARPYRTSMRLMPHGIECALCVQGPLARHPCSPFKYACLNRPDWR